MSQSIKLEKLNSLILRELNIIFKKDLQNISIINPLTLHEVVTTNDYSQSKIYYSVVDTNINLNSLEKALSKQNKMIRHKLSQKLSIYKTPKLIFIYDKTLDNAEKIQNILYSVKDSNENK